MTASATLVVTNENLHTVTGNDAADKSSVDGFAASFAFDQPQHRVRYLCVQVAKQVVTPHHQCQLSSITVAFVFNSINSTL